MWREAANAMDWCSHAIVVCPNTQENHCDSFEAKQACLWDDVIAGCNEVSRAVQYSRAWHTKNTCICFLVCTVPHHIVHHLEHHNISLGNIRSALLQCTTKGCQHVIEYMATNEALNATYGDNEDAKSGAMLEMAWKDACSSVRTK